LQGKFNISEDNNIIAVIKSARKPQELLLPKGKGIVNGGKCRLLFLIGCGIISPMYTDKSGFEWEELVRGLY